MSVAANDPREALSVLCLASSSLESLEEWIPDEEPNLDWFNRPRNPSNPDPEGFDQRPAGKAPEVHLDAGPSWACLS